MIPGSKQLSGPESATAASHLNFPARFFEQSLLAVLLAGKPD
jgi:hypothetical protein